MVKGVCQMDFIITITRVRLKYEYVGRVYFEYF